MTETQAAEWVSYNLTAIYGYAFARLYDKNKVEDLTSEIICEILSSVKKLKNDEAFSGFAWKIAENTFRKFLRRESQEMHCETLENCDVADIYHASVAQEYMEREEKARYIYLLRRELSLLTKLHREVCVSYYVDNKSCSQIAEEQKISVEMVKYHLFKTRKLLKEGIGMTRILGEKSYNPGTFRLDFWGDWFRYGDLFKRKLPGSIVLATYYVPMTAEELSVELGVAMPYLEEEIEILEKAGVLFKSGNKYQANIVIITDDYEKEFVRKSSEVYHEIANSVFEKVSTFLSPIRQLDFQGKEYDDNRLMFALLNIAMVNGYILAKKRSPLGAPHALALGGNGWIFGYDNDYINHHFHGVTLETWNKEKTAWFSAENYRVISQSQRYDHTQFKEKAEVMCDAVLGKSANKENTVLPWLIENGFILCRNDVLKANFPVFSRDVFADVCQILEPVADTVAQCMMEISDKAETMLKDHVPPPVRSQCGDIAKIHHRLDVAAFLMEELVAEGKITVPSEKIPLCVWGVIA